MASIYSLYKDVLEIVLKSLELSEVVALAICSKQLTKNVVLCRYNGVYKNKSCNISRALTSRFGSKIVSVSPTTFKLHEVKRITRRISLLAVRASGNFLYSVPDQFKDDEMCLSAVISSKDALIHVPEEMKSEEIYLASVRSHGASIRYIPEKKRNIEIWLAAFHNDPETFRYIPDKHKTEAMCIEAVTRSINNFHCVPKWLMTEELAFIAVSSNSKLMGYIPNIFRSERVLFAILPHRSSSANSVHIQEQEYRGCYRLE